MNVVVLSWADAVLVMERRPHFYNDLPAARLGTNDGVAMLEGLFQPMHLMVIFGLALLIFGPKKLPELVKGIGESIRGV